MLVDENKSEETEVEEEFEAPKSDAEEIRSLIETAYKEQAEEPKEETEPKESSSRQRDDKGRFVKADDAPTPKVSDQATSDTKPEPETAPLAAPPAIEAPHSWSAEKRELWSKLPPEAQEYIAQRDREVQKALSRRMSQQPEQAGKFEQTVERYKDVFEKVDSATGMRVPIDPHQGMEALLIAQRKLATNFPQAVAEMARANGYHVELKPITNPDGSAMHAAPAFSPVIQHLTSKVQTLEQHLAEREQRQQQQYLTSHIEAFKNEKDGSGQLAHPFFEDVKAHMGRIVDYLEATEPGLTEREYLARAYDEAVWANPQTREKVKAADIDRVRREQEQKAKVQRAERAGSIVKGSPGAGSLNVQVGDSVQDIIRAAYEGRI